MPKFQSFHSPFAYLANKISLLRKASAFYYRVNRFDDPDNTEGLGCTYQNKLIPYFFGGFNPLLAMGKDFIDTFKPYKSGSYYVLRDFLQPLRGLGNILRGLFNITLSPLLFLARSLVYFIAVIIFKESNSWSSFFNNMKINCAQSGGGLLNGVFSIIRGITQIATTPATWFLRMPLRGLISCCRGRPTFISHYRNKAAQIETLVGIPDQNKTAANTLAIDHGLEALYRKSYKAIRRGQNLGVTRDAFLKKKPEITDTDKFTAKEFTQKGFERCTAITMDESVDLDETCFQYTPNSSPQKAKNALLFLSLFNQSNLVSSETSSTEKVQLDSSPS